LSAANDKRRLIQFSQFETGSMIFNNGEESKDLVFVDNWFDDDFKRKDD